MYDPNGCYFKEGSKLVTEINPSVFYETTATIDADKLLIEWPYSEDPEEFLYNSTITESEDDLKMYSVNPVDGNYTDCTNKDKI